MAPGVGGSVGGGDGIGGGIDSSSSGAWKNTVLPATREQNAYTLFTAMHPNPWAVPDLLFQAMLLESEIFHSCTSSGQYILVAAEVSNFLYRHRGVIYSEYIYGFGARALTEFLQDRRMGTPQLGRAPIPFLPRLIALLPSFQLPPAPPIPNLLMLDNIQQTRPNLREPSGFSRSL